MFVPRQRALSVIASGVAGSRRTTAVLKGQTDTHAQISAKMLNEAFYIYNEALAAIAEVRLQQPASSSQRLLQMLHPVPHRL